MGIDSSARVQSLETQMQSLAAQVQSLAAQVQSLAAQVSADDVDVFGESGDELKSGGGDATELLPVDSVRGNSPEPGCSDYAAGTLLVESLDDSNVKVETRADGTVRIGVYYA